jgi:hypothetical protein
MRFLSSDDFFRAFVDFQIWDLPGGQLDPEAFGVPLAQVGSVIYVLDGQVRISLSIIRLTRSF